MCDKEKAKEIFLAGLSAVMPKNLIGSALAYHDNTLTIQEQHYNLSTYKNLYLYGSGKASIEMAKALKALLGDRIAHSMVVSNYHDRVDGVEVVESTHPLPSAKSIAAAEKLIAAFEGMGEDDFFIYLLSGGSSALIEKPIDGVSLEDFIALTRLLLESGLSIDEINTIRKNFSQIKGGGLGGKTKAKGIVLVVSDVIRDDLQAIASAPLLADTSTMKDVQKIVDKYNIFDKLPQNIQDILQDENAWQAKRVHSFPHFLIASNHLALALAKEYAVGLGLSSKIITDSLEGDVDVVSEFILTSAREERESVLLFGGEPTVEVKGKGKGGRNQELCLRLLEKMQESDDFTFLSAGTDGIDGNSDAAGGVICRVDYHDSLKSYLKNSDSYHYLQKKSSLIMTGASGTNVMDMMIVLKG